MKIFIIAHDVGSEEMGMVFRPYHIAQGLKARGHQVEIITASYSRVRSKNPQIHKNLEVHSVEGIPYHWIKSLKFSGNSIQRALGMLLFSIQLWRFAGYFVKRMKVDTVIASSPHPLIVWGAHRIARKSRAKFIFEVRDIWPLSMHELSGMSQRHPFYVLCQWAEDFAYKNADKVVSLLPYAYDHMKSRGLAQDKFICIPNGFHKKAGLLSEPLPFGMNEKLVQFKNQFPRIVGYAGAHSLANSLETLIDAFAILKDQERIGLVLIGDGSEKFKLQKKTQALNLDNVLFLEPVSKNQIRQIINYFDIAYIGLKKTPLFKYGVSPNKLIDYMSLGKAVLYAIESNNDPVQESGCGVKILPDNPEEAAVTIKKMNQLTDAELVRIGALGKTWVQQHLDYTQLLTKYEQIL